MRTATVTQLLVVLGGLSTTGALPSWVSNGLKPNAGSVADAEITGRLPSLPVHGGDRDYRYGNPVSYPTNIPTAMTAISSTAGGDPSILVGGLGFGQGTTLSTATSSDVDSTTTIIVTLTSTITTTTTPGVPVAPGSVTTPADHPFTLFPVANQTVAAAGTGTALFSGAVSSGFSTLGGKAVAIPTNTTFSKQLGSMTQSLSRELTTEVSSVASVVLPTSVLPGVRSNTTASSNSSLPAYATGYYAPTGAATRVGIVNGSSIVSTTSSGPAFPLPSNSTAASKLVASGSGLVLSASANVSTLALGLDATRSAVHSSFSTGALSTGNNVANMPASSSGLYVNTTTAVPVASLKSALSSNLKTASILNSSITATANGASASLGSLHTAGGTASAGMKSASNFTGFSITYTPTGSGSKPTMTTANCAESSVVFSYHDPSHVSLSSLHTATGTASTGLKSGSNFAGLSVVYTPTASSGSKPTMIAKNGSDSSVAMPYHKPSYMSYGSLQTASGTASAGMKSGSNFTGLSIRYTPTASAVSKPTMVAANVSSTSSVHPIILTSGPATVSVVVSTMIMKSSTAVAPPFSNSTSVPKFSPSNTMTVGNGIYKSTGITNSTGVTNSTVLTNSSDVNNSSDNSNSTVGGINASSTRSSGTTSAITSSITTSAILITATPTPYHSHSYSDSDDYEEFEMFKEFEEFEKFEHFEEYEKLHGDGSDDDDFNGDGAY